MRKDRRKDVKSSHFESTEQIDIGTPSVPNKYLYYIQLAYLGKFKTPRIKILIICTLKKFKNK